MSEKAIVLYDERFANWQRGRGEVRIIKRDFSWGESVVIVGNEVRPRFAGVSIKLVMIEGLAGGPIRLRFPDQSRYPNQGYSCTGCPFFGVDEYLTSKCAYPFYLSLYGCPQAVPGRGEFSAYPSCPMLGMRSARAQRRYRVRVTSERIFWKYYHDAGKSGYREGFVPFREW